ncbi:MAG: hypothetical protein K0Q59_5838, partial [Paenibacillus sp.]|nr:hypothetical protein [Paenibacillus sp.]
MNKLLAGIDIGGTKCAVLLGECDDEQVRVLDKIRFPTPDGPEPTMRAIIASLAKLLDRSPVPKPLSAIGISCGGPLDSRQGLICSPPNLPGWDRIDIVTPLRERFRVPVGLQNDANACALAEWKWGAGRGTSDMVFLTFGTGMGAGLIVNGRLHTGRADMAGEVGHVRLERSGPVGYGKPGSFEGFCSGAGIARLARSLAQTHLERGERPLFCPAAELLPEVTAQKVGEAASDGDELALRIFRIAGEKLGEGLAILVDVLNPECIVIGGIYTRQQ